MSQATNVIAQKHTVSRDKRGEVLGNNGAGFRYTDKALPKLNAELCQGILKIIDATIL